MEMNTVYWESLVNLVNHPSLALPLFSVFLCGGGKKGLVT